MVNVETAGRDLYLEEASDVLEFQVAFGVLANDSLNQEQSVSLIKQLIS